MLRSLFAGVSGMRTHQLNMDVIADNIANVNTAGFKASRMTFKEVYSQLLRGAQKPMAPLGGINPLQVGLGVAVGSIDTLFAQGAPQSTGRDTDLAIDGNGFFILTPDGGTTRLYTRAGNFGVDSEGNLVYTNGMKVMGWTADPAGAIDTNQPIGALKVAVGTQMPPAATTQVTLGGNLDSRLTNPLGNPVSLSLNVFDSLGASHPVTLTFTPVGPNTWTLAVSGPSGVGFVPPGSPQVTFNPDGSFSSSTPSPVVFQFNPPNADPVQVTLDFTGMTQYAQASEPTVLAQDGHAAGALVRFTVDSAGVINGVFSNGLNRNLGQIALATFPNQEGLVKQSDTLFSVSPNTGDPVVGPPQVGSKGKLIGGFLEMSNVDLSQEFTNLILAQRGFQANSRVITTSDELLQELMTLKR